VATRQDIDFLSVNQYGRERLLSGRYFLVSRPVGVLPVTDCGSPARHPHLEAEIVENCQFRGRQHDLKSFAPARVIRHFSHAKVTR